MSLYNRHTNILWLLVIMVSTISCEKFLDEKPDQKLAVPSTLRDFQALMENSTYIQYAGPSEGEVSSDDYYLTASDLANISSPTDRNIHLWNGLIDFADKGQSGWSIGYRTIYYCNSVIDGLKNNMSDDDRYTFEWNNIAGQAHYFRGNAFFDLAQIWAPAYELENSTEGLGLPLRLETDFNRHVDRATVSETYDQIIHDLNKAIALLPVNSNSKWRPSKPAAYGLLARAYLSMREYEQAARYADSCLAMYPTLMDYNMLDLTSNAPIPADNDEVICYRTMETVDPIRVTIAKMDTALYSLYDSNDLRRAAFFRSRPDSSWRFQGSYTGTNGFFSGLASDEVYLIKAECLAREGMGQEALAVMDELLENRYERVNGESTWTGKNFESHDAILDFILEERRKELVMRGLRWIDIRRLNLEGRNIDLKREIDGQVYSLPASDKRFVLPIPADVVRISGITQNER